MSGMAGNVTAFNSVWTYDIYQAYLNKKASDQHYLRVARVANIVGILVSVATAYLATRFNNIMDLLQLVFGFINAPLFATFLLGMFWKRTTGHGAFAGLLSGTFAAALFHGLTVAEGQGGWLGAELFTFHSTMAQALTIAIVAWSVCFVVTALVSLMTKAKDESLLRGLVYSLTEKPSESASHWLTRPAFLASVVIIATIILNIVFA
jgi:SSS family solute:Na+ symporter